MRTGTRRGDDPFFTQKTCDRCGEPLNVRTLSWFNNDTIGPKCMEKEKAIKEALKARGRDPAQYEACGYIPDPATA